MSVLNGYSQDAPSPFRIWKLVAISGEVRVKGTYREFELIRNKINSSTQKDYYLNGLLHINTKSFFVHPNFMLVNFSGTYNPITRKNKYIGIPEYNENYYSEGLDASTILFSKKRVNLTGNAIINKSIQNIENITRIKTDNKQLGAGFSYINKILPLTIGYSKQNTVQQVIGSDNKFTFEQRLLQAGTSASFTNSDHHYLAYLHTENNGTENYTGSNAQPLNTVNKIDQYELNNEITFDSLKNYTFYSSIINSIERGDIYFKRLYVRENLTLKFLKNVIWTNNYNFGITELDSNKVKYQGIQSSLSHQLYKSLSSKLVYERNQTDQPAYKDQRNKYGIDLRYVKLIPKGKLTLLYSYYREYQRVKTAPTTLRIAREEYLISDNTIILFKNQNINIQSVEVRDVTGTIIYQLNVDYILTEHTPYLEISRIPGGLIANNSTVYISYTALQAGNYNYFMDNYSFSADVLLFGNKLDVYYRSNSQDYNIQNKTENLALNYFNRNAIGTRLDLNYFKGGVEYEYYYSTILPYKAVRYFIELQKMYKKVSFTLTGNLQNIKMSSETGKRQDLDVSTKIAYSLLKNVRVDFDVMYRSIKGRGINLDLTTSKLEITTDVHRLLFSVGAEFYQNKEVDSKMQFKGVYVQLTRNF